MNFVGTGQRFQSFCQEFCRSRLFTAILPAPLTTGFENMFYETTEHACIRDHHCRNKTVLPLSMTTNKERSLDVITINKIFLTDCSEDPGLPFL